MYPRDAKSTQQTFRERESWAHEDPEPVPLLFPVNVACWVTVLASLTPSSQPIQRLPLLEDQFFFFHLFVLVAG